MFPGEPGNKCYVAIKVLCRSCPRSRQHAGTRLTRLLQGIVYDVTGNKAYQPGGSYNGMFTAPLLST